MAARRSSRCCCVDLALNSIVQCSISSRWQQEGGCEKAANARSWHACGLRALLYPSLSRTVLHVSMLSMHMVMHAQCVAASTGRSAEVKLYATASGWLAVNPAAGRWSSRLSLTIVCVMYRLYCMSSRSNQRTLNMRLLATLHIRLATHQLQRLESHRTYSVIFPCVLHD